LLLQAARGLAEAGVDAPRLTAEVLLAHVLGITRTQLLSRPERQLSAETLAPFQSLVSRAAQGEPLAYLTGRREFYGLDFLVDSRVLVPRPETELLVDFALTLHAPRSTLHILDIGAGSGCIAITLALKLPAARVTAIDISPEALALARLNAERHGVSNRVTFIQSDLLSNLQFSNLQSPVSNLQSLISNLQSPITNYQLLIANLPYIPSDELPRLPVARHEPALALDGGPDGLALIRRLLADAPRLMASRGRLLLEIGAAQGEAAAALARAAFPSAQIEIHQDLAGHDRRLDIFLTDY